MPDDSNWNTPVASPRASISYVFLSSIGSAAMSRSPISSTALSITSRLRRPRKSIFSRPSASTSPPVNCVTSSWSAPFCCSGTMFDQRLGADHDAGRVDRVGARQAFERTRQIEDLLGDRVRVHLAAELGARLEALVERLPRAFGDELRDLVDDAVRNLEHPLNTKAVFWF